MGVKCEHLLSFIQFQAVPIVSKERCVCVHVCGGREEVSSFKVFSSRLTSSKFVFLWIVWSGVGECSFVCAVHSTVELPPRCVCTLVSGMLVPSFLVYVLWSVESSSLGQQTLGCYACGVSLEPSPWLG
ncbi:unnamed protein product [Discosporangium mesarthrocarpum]